MSAAVRPEAAPIDDPAKELEATAGRLDAAMARVGDLDPSARAVVDEVLESLNTLHRDGLTTIVRRLRDDERGRELLYELVDDPTVHMLFAMHQIIRPDPTTLARQALDQCRGQLQSHGGDAEFDHIADGVAYIRLQGACNGCSMAAVTLRGTVEAALLAAVPGLTAVEVLPNDPTPTLIPLSSLSVRPPDDDALAREVADLEATGWCQTILAADLGDGEVQAMTVHPKDGPAVETIVVRAGGSLSAYVNECAHQSRPLDDALVDSAAGTLTCPWHGLCYDAASGECLTLPGAQLISLPSRVVGDHVWIRPAG